MVNSQILKTAFLNGALNLISHENQLNSINFFSSPNGNTGTNLASTLSGCAKEIKNLPPMGAGRLATEIAESLSDNAKGNSGIILSVIFSGFAESVERLDVIDAISLAKGLDAGCNHAYAAVKNPTEGTILTVIRLAASKAVSSASKAKNSRQVFCDAVNAAAASLKSTPNLLPVLKKYGCVDAGGQGLVYIMEGMLSQTAENQFTEIINGTERKH